MSQLVVCIAGLLLAAESQASDVSDRSTLQGFLPKYMPSGSDASKSSMSAHDKFITPNFKFAKHGDKADAAQMMDWSREAVQKLDRDEKQALHGNKADAAQMMDWSRKAVQKLDRDEKQAVQKLARGSSNPISLAAIGVGLLSLVAVLGVRLRWGLQRAFASRDGLALDMPLSMASAQGDNVMEMRSQDSHKISSSSAGWGQISSQNTQPSTLCYALESQALETQEDLKSLAKSLNPAVGYYDPLNIGEEDWSLWNYNNERKIAWFRQAEIKHGRVAMAAFVGYCVQANGGHWVTKMTLEGADWPTGTPPEQWDALPEASKWQIILFVGILEFFDESIPPHYTNGRKPGQFPSFSDAYKEGKGFPHPVPFDLYDPFGFSKNASAEKKARGLRIEINNGRLAMLAVFGFMSASKVPGSVPALANIIPPYNGDYMIPFEGNFNLFG